MGVFVLDVLITRACFYFVLLVRFPWGMGRWWSVGRCYGVQVLRSDLQVEW